MGIVSLCCSCESTVGIAVIGIRPTSQGTPSGEHAICDMTVGERFGQGSARFKLSTNVSTSCEVAPSAADNKFEIKHIVAGNLDAPVMLVVVPQPMSCFVRQVVA